MSELPGVLPGTAEYGTMISILNPANSVMLRPALNAPDDLPFLQVCFTVGADHIGHVYHYIPKEMRVA
jgi:hypothetical protein